jgi:hypothetical protein
LGGQDFAPEQVFAPSGAETLCLINRDASPGKAAAINRR